MPTNTEKMEWMVESVGRLVRRGALPNILKIFDKAHPVEVSHVLRNLRRVERGTAFAALFEHDLQKAADALSELRTEVGIALLESMDVADIEKLLHAMTPDDAAVFMDELPEGLREELLGRMEVTEKAEVGELLEFPSETAGRIMTPNVIAMNENLTVGGAISDLQRRSEDPEMVFYLYVVDDRSHLVGVVSLSQLLRYSPATPLKEIMTTNVISVRAGTDQEEVSRLVADYNLLAVPVVDDENKLVGLVTVDDVIDVIREEATEDILALAGVDADDRALGYAQKSFRRRIPWLLVSLVTALLVVFVIQQFEESLKKNIFIAFLLPLVAAIGGHAATQTMTVIVRGISTGEVNSETGRRAFIKEVLVGLSNGLVVGVVGGGMVAAISWDWLLGLVVLLALMLIMLVASFVGALVPMVLKRLNFDPAVASSVFVITITDVLGFLAFLGLATIALKWVGS